jgi:hypothetical protein
LTGWSIVIKKWYQGDTYVGVYPDIPASSVTPFVFEARHSFGISHYESAATFAQIDLYRPNGTKVPARDILAFPTNYGTGILPVGSKLLLNPGLPVQTFDVLWDNFLSEGYHEDYYYYEVIPDSDGDGLTDDVDHCVLSDVRPTIFINNEDTGVGNDLMPDGCTLADLIHEALTEAEGIQSYIAEMVGMLLDLKQDGAITGQEMGLILKALTPP